jgi:type IV secretory pathway VirB4 component
MKIYYKTKEDRLLPKNIKEEKNNIKVNNKFYKTYYISDFPVKINKFFVSELFSLGGNLILTQYISPLKKDEVLNSIKIRLSSLESQRHSRLSKGRLNDISLDLEVTALEDFRRILVSGKEGSSLLSFYITLYSTNLYNLKINAKNLELLASSKSFTMYSLDFRESIGYKSIVPFNINKGNKTFVLNSSSISAATPFVINGFTDYKGIIYGVNSITNSLTLFDIFNYENYNGVIFAKSGSGKSFFAKTTIIRLIAKGIKVVIIDPEGEYKNLCKNLKGKRIEFSHNSKYKINPFDLYQGESIEDKIQFIKSFLQRSCTYFDGNELDKALVEVFRTIKEPTFKDLYNYLEKNKSKMALEIYNISAGSNATLYSEKTNIEISNKDNLIVFDISKLDTYNISLMMYIVLNFVWKFHDGKSKREVFIDEAHRLFESKELLTYLKMISKRARKYNLGLIYITQDIEDFISSEEGRSIIANTSLKVLMKQEKVNLDNISKTFILSNEEKDSLLKFNIGESLLFFGDLRLYNRSFAFNFEKDMFD